MLFALVLVVSVVIAFFLGAAWQSRQNCVLIGAQSEWRLSILMNIVNGGNYPLTLALTHKGRATTLPTGAQVVWTVSDPTLGAVTPDPNDPTKASLIAGDIGATGTVSAKVTFTGADGNAAEVDATSEALTVIGGDPDGATIAVGAELPG